MITRKRGDTSQPLVVTATDWRGYAIDLTGATGVIFRMKLAGATTYKVNATAVVTDAENGLISYTFEGEDVDTAGVYTCEFKYTLSGGRQTLPSDSVLRIRIQEDLADPA
jgi:hypothetical protein